MDIVVLKKRNKMLSLVAAVDLVDHILVKMNGPQKKKKTDLT